jgi:hypothetical protein
MFQSTKKEILAAVAAIMFTTYIITMVVIQVVSPLDHAEKVNAFLLQWAVNISMGMGIIVLVTAIIAFFVAPLRRRR